MTSRVTLRAVLDADLPIFFEQQLEPEATQLAGFPTRERDAFMAHWAKIRRGDGTVLRTILYFDQVAGNIVSWEQAGKREVGYWLGKEFWGKGIATQALAQFLNVVTTRPVYAYVVKGNLASQRVLEKCGFTRCDEDQEGYLFKID